MDKTMLGYLVVFIIAFFGRSFWDWTSTGRVKKEAPYVTSKTCEEHRGKCCVGSMKRDMADLTARLAIAEKRLDQGSQDFRELKKELAAINKTLAGMQALIENKVEKIVVT